MPTVIFTLKSYLQKLQDIESIKPKLVRRSIPKLKQIAKACGTNDVVISRLVNRRSTTIRLEMIAGIIHELHQRGFDTKISDLLIFVEDDSDRSEKNPTNE